MYTARQTAFSMMYTGLVHHTNCHFGLVVGMVNPNYHTWIRQHCGANSKQNQTHTLFWVR